MEVIKYSINAAEIAKMSDIYMGLIIKGLDDHEGLDAVHTARMVCVKHRTSIDKLRKSSNEDAQAFIKNNNNNAKKLLILLEPIESHLRHEEDMIEAEKARIKAEADRIEKEKIQTRVDEFLKVDVVLPFIDIALMTHDEYMDKLNDATGKYVEKQIHIKAEQKAREEEKAKLAAERAEIERIKAEQEARAKAITEKEASLILEREAIEEAKRAETARKELEALEKRLAEEAKIKAEKEALEKIEREAAEKIEKEKAEADEKERKEALRPDREKLAWYAETIRSLRAPDVENEMAKVVIFEAKRQLIYVVDNILKHAEEL